ncbi:acyl-CoA oxidase [Trametopsis cervina]|nr:acyl-CoA oxidase [Trametopsis cervina]
MTPRLPHEQAHTDLLEERRRTTLDIPQLREYLHGGKDQWELHDEIVKLMSSDPVFSKARWIYMSRPERYKNVLRMIHRVHELQDKHKWSQAQFKKAISLLDETHPYTLHQIAFEPVFTSQASPELLEQYGDLVANAGIIGCYLQTELAHGSSLVSLETTATYLPATREFELHSPTFTARKWWIGGAGRFATHGVVVAQLVLPGGKRAGPHLFFVQLRSLDDHSVMPGITLGDIGPKAMGAWQTTDNGYAVFDHVRIPAGHMLSKFAQVTEDGQYVRPPHAKISYGGMMYIRSTMITNAGWTSAKAISIAIRYTHARRQGVAGPDGLEPQVISYPSVYARLLPILSRAYVYIFLGRNLENSFTRLSSRLAQGDTTLLAEMHATTSGLKSLVTTQTVHDLEAARRVLGGHGFSEAAGIGRIYATYLPNVTFEGDNYVLDLQVVRAAVKAFRAYSSAKTPSESSPSAFTRFVRHWSTVNLSRSHLRNLDWTHIPSLVRLLEYRALCLVGGCVKNEACGGVDPTEAARTAKAITEAYVAAEVERFASELPTYFSDGVQRVMHDLFLLYLLTTVEGALADLLSFDILALPDKDSHGDRTRALRMAMKEVYLRILPHTVGLTDAFGFSDWELDSALGVYDGKVYEALWERSQREPLNATNIPDGYEEYIKPLLKRGQQLATAGGRVAKL